MLETTFYILGIIFMVSWLLFFIGIVIMAVIVAKKIKAIQLEATEKAYQLKEMGKMKIAGMIGTAIATFVIDKLKNRMDKEEKE